MLSDLLGILKSKRFLGCFKKYILLACILSAVFIPIYVTAFSSINKNERQIVYDSMESGFSQLTGYVLNLVNKADIILQDQAISKVAVLRG